MKSVDDKKLIELELQVDSLEQRQAEQSAVVAGLRRDLEQAKEDDLNREAAALQTEAAKPKPKAPEIERALQAAQHDFEVIGRALQMAQDDASRYKAKNCEKLVHELAKAKAGRAKEVSTHARPLLEAIRGFYQVDDDSKELRPYIRQDVETGPPGSGSPERYTLDVGGGMTTRNVYGDRVAGLERGQLEGVIRSLVQLSSAYAEPNSHPGEVRASPDALEAGGAESSSPGADQEEGGAEQHVAS
jgi:hypothetical protein